MSDSLSLDRHRVTGEIVVVVKYDRLGDGVDVDADEFDARQIVRLAGFSDADLLGFAAEITAACQQNLVNTQRGLPVADTEPPPKVVEPSGRINMSDFDIGYRAWNANVLNVDHTKLGAQLRADLEPNIVPVKS